ncbi:MAG: NAD(P)H-dependent oxidoreductase subunit E [Clostridia bacterium]|nr:NAD(P)H-dependent oxidoreductase subunit E [Clostridia bacterium]
MSIVSFEGTKEQEAALRSVIETHKNERGCLMPILHQAQDIYGYLPCEVQSIIADALSIPLSEVFGVATFYTRFTLNPKGRHQVSVCLGTACYVKGSDKLLEEVEKELRITCGECTPDGEFSLDSCRCVGACGLAPVIIVDERVYGRVKPSQVKGILDTYRQTDGGIK